MDRITPYAGFWRRSAGAVIDIASYGLVSTPILVLIYGRAYLDYRGLAPLGLADFLITWVAPMVGLLGFWITKSATPGKMILRMRIIDARTGGKPSNAQFVTRLLGSWLSALALGVGYLWAAADEMNRTWHDKMAGTVVIHEGAQEAVVSA